MGRVGLIVPEENQSPETFGFPVAERQGYVRHESLSKSLRKPATC